MGTNNIIEYAKKNAGAISAKEYNKLLRASDGVARTKSSPKETLSKKIIAKKNPKEIALNSKYDFNFLLEVAKIDDVSYKFTLKGRHYSTNDVNSWLSFGKRNAYKTAIKKSFYDYFMINSKNKPDICFEKSIIYSISYNPSSRDDDGNRITLKPFRDMLTEYGFILDDKRSCFFEFPNFEVKDKEYKIEVILISVGVLPTLEDFFKTTFRLK